MGGHKALNLSPPSACASTCPWVSNLCLSLFLIIHPKNKIKQLVLYKSVALRQKINVKRTEPGSHRHASCLPLKAVSWDDRASTQKRAVISQEPFCRRSSAVLMNSVVIIPIIVVTAIRGLQDPCLQAPEQHLSISVSLLFLNPLISWLELGNYFFLC